MARLVGFTKLEEGEVPPGFQRAVGRPPGEAWDLPRGGGIIYDGRDDGGESRPGRRDWRVHRVDPPGRVNGRFMKVNPADLIPSHKVNQSPREMAALKESIRDKGFLHNTDQPVA